MHQSLLLLYASSSASKSVNQNHNISAQKHDDTIEDIEGGQTTDIPVNNAVAMESMLLNA